jgi:lipoyl synthase
MPPWLKRPIAFTGRMAFVEESISRAGLHTVCREAKCPNRAQCHARGTATFLILGDVCTRHCRFCNVKRGVPKAVDPEESLRLCDAAVGMGLHHVVVTSVTRDDLPDGGAEMFAGTVHALRKRLAKVTIELLVPDFRGDEKALATVIESGPDIFSHNIETVPRLYEHVRPQASYERSLNLLAKAANRHRAPLIKSGLMVGLGERAGEVENTMIDLKKAGCSLLTIGQYLRPSTGQTPVVEFITPDMFQWYEGKGRELGFFNVVAGPYIRSSYKADEMVEEKNDDAIFHA